MDIKPTNNDDQCARNSIETKKDVPTVLSCLEDYTINLESDVYDYLASQYDGLYNTDDDDFVWNEGSLQQHTPCEKSRQHLNHILTRMKTSPTNVTCRVNLIKGTPSQIKSDIEAYLMETIPNHNQQQQFHVQQNSYFTDVLDIVPVSKPPEINADSNNNNNDNDLFPHWSDRKELGWKKNYPVIICDRLCGEVVLRGSNIFVRGVMVADANIRKGQTVAVYVDIKGKHRKNNVRILRGLMLKEYAGQCVFLGYGKACCDRGAIFTQSTGLAVEMLGSRLPSLNGCLVEGMLLQNLPSIAVGHALDPQKGDVILDMCACPGGKTSHVASLMNNDGIIVATDKSHKKIVIAHSFFQRIGATCITPIALNATDCVNSNSSDYKSVADVLKLAERDEEEGLIIGKGLKFYPESFDRIVLDPPCSALGLRPKLYWKEPLKKLTKYAEYQKKFVDNAICLLRPGGFMTYSTCTIHASENECMVSYILNNYPSMELVPLSMDGGQFGQPGLPGMGLTDSQRHFVCRFDPTNQSKDDTMGFFLAKFVKKETACKKQKQR